MPYRAHKTGLTVLCLAFLSACGGQNEGPAGPMGGQMPATKVTITELVPSVVTLSSEMAGRTVSYNQAEVRPEVSGIIRERCFQEGSDVKAADVLYIIDPDTYQAAFDSAKAALSKAEASLSVAQLKHQRTSELYKTKSVSQQDYDDARASYLQAQAEISSAKAALRSAEINLDRTKVRAPISGRIGKSSVAVGALVTASQPAALSSIYQTSPMNVDLTPAVDELRSLRTSAKGTGASANVASPEGLPDHDTDDMQAEVSLRLSDGTAYDESGLLRFTDVGVDESTGTVTIRAEFPNARHELLPGMFVRATVKMGTQQDALLVPQQAVLRDSRGMPFVFVAVPGDTGEKGTQGTLKAQRRSVKLGAAYGESWLVQEGLNPGDKLIVGGAHRVRQNATVVATDTADVATQVSQNLGKHLSGPEGSVSGLAVSGADKGVAMTGGQV